MLIIVDHFLVRLVLHCQKCRSAPQRACGKFRCGYFSQVGMGQILCEPGWKKREGRDREREREMLCITSTQLTSPPMYRIGEVPVEDSSSLRRPLGRACTAAGDRETELSGSHAGYPRATGGLWAASTSASTGTAGMGVCVFTLDSYGVCGSVSFFFLRFFLSGGPSMYCARWVQ